MKKIKVLHMIKTLQLGGAEKNLFNLIRALGPDVESHVAYCYGGEFEPAFQEAGIPLFCYSRHNHKIKSFQTLLSVVRLWRYIRLQNINIVHTHNFNGHILGLVTGKLAGVKIVEHVHDFRYIDSAERKRGHWFVAQYDHIWKLKNRSDRVIVLTSQNMEFLIRHSLYPEDKIRLIRNGIPLEQAPQPVKDLRGRWNIPEDSSVVLTPARVSAEKNIDLIFKIAPFVIREWGRTIFLIAGDGPLIEDYKRRTREEHLEMHFRFIGFYPEMADLLGISTLFLLPSFLELHSIALLEAMSMKVPAVISRHVGCNSELFTDWQDAVLLDPYQPQEWGNVIVKLLKDGRLRQSLAERAFVFCRDHFNINDTAVTIKKVYTELVE